MPYVNTLESRLESPCSNCESPYSYKHRLDLTQNTAIFGDRVNGTQVSGNLDGPEGGFDALMQAIVCGEVSPITLSAAAGVSMLLSSDRSLIFCYLTSIFAVK